MHKKKGFTLVELMIVIAIIGILVAISGPAIQEYFNKGESTTIQTQNGSGNQASGQFAREAE